MKSESKKDYVSLYYKELSQKCDPKDFWGQVKRTVDGKPISQEQIALIEKTVSSCLDLNKNDHVLDIGCGNGALSVLFYDKINSLTGVDFSEYLISVARENFEKAPNFTFHLGDAYAFIRDFASKDKITKALCYGTFSYFSATVAREMLQCLNKEYANIERVFIGNLPDKARADRFYYKDVDYKEQLDDPQSPIGIWRTEEEMTALAAGCGWQIEFHRMPEGFHGAHYRYDVLLTR